MRRLLVSAAVLAAICVVPLAPSVHAQQYGGWLR